MCSRTLLFKKVLTSDRMNLYRILSFVRINIRYEIDQFNFPLLFFPYNDPEEKKTKTSCIVPSDMMWFIKSLTAFQMCYSIGAILPPVLVPSALLHTG